MKRLSRGRVGKRWIPFFPLVFFCLNASAQTTHRQPASANDQQTISWQGVRKAAGFSGQPINFLFFEEAQYDFAKNQLPFLSVYKELPFGAINCKVTLDQLTFEALTAEEEKALVGQPEISENLVVKTKVSYHRKKPIGVCSIIPLRKNALTGKVEKLTHYKLSWQHESGNGPVRASRSSVTNSVLGSGEWFKIAVAEDGIYRIDYNYLKNLGIDMATLDPRTLKVYGNGGGMLPYANQEFRYDDLEENAVLVEGEADGVFDPEDALLFYGQAADRWTRTGNEMRFRPHYYSDSTYYFLTYGQGNGERIQIQSGPGGSAPSVNSFDDVQIYNRDLRNLLKSGAIWYGEEFDVVTHYDFLFDFPNIITSSPVRLYAGLAAHTAGPANASSFSVKVGSLASGNVTIPGLDVGYEFPVAARKSQTLNFNPTGPTINVDIDFIKGLSTARGWLDYIEIQCRRSLQFTGGQMNFRDIASVGSGNVEYRISQASADLKVWDVTDPTNVFQPQANFAAGQLTFKATTDSLREFIAYDGSNFLQPAGARSVINQNLHFLGQQDYLIVTHKDYLAEAEELAEFHREKEGLRVAVATTEQVYNEFSCGAPDITAIKDFVRMFYLRAGTDTTQMPRYLLLFGDGSYDFKDVIQGNSNRVPVYQSHESHSNRTSYATDDYFGLLDDQEGDGVTEMVDIGIGRLPVRSRKEAREQIQKIRHYYTTNTLGRWRNEVTFVGDDEDQRNSLIHMTQADELAKIVEKDYPVYNPDKIYFDAYTQVSQAGGTRYPDVNEAILRKIENGTLLMSYTGHGGELGWAHEDVLSIADINSLENLDKLPLFITATCEFSRFDDPQRTAAGEYVLLNPRGGGIALLTTTRLVTSHDNQSLARAFINAVFSGKVGARPRLGDIYRLTKLNTTAFEPSNTRKFSLLGDPALTLAYPKYDVITTSAPDTIKALSKVTITGFVADENGVKQDNFNGIIYPTVFDSPLTITTLNNEGWGPFIFDLQRNIVFKGRASVKNGEFSFTFVAPYDISLSYGKGKISYYVDNGVEDGHGYYSNFVIGGRESGLAWDNVRPEVDLYMNDQTFVFGGITDNNPDMLALVYDENGINTVGTGIGHDLIAELDGETANPIVLNDYYESELDSYQRGKIRYPFSKLKEGKHTLRVKVWDVYNNSGESRTEFVVAKSEDLALDHILNYPNPFTTNTGFYFEHNQPGQELQVRIQIFTVSGKLVKVLDRRMETDGYRVGPISWNGRDTYGDKLGRGVYVYQLKVIAPSGETAEEFEKLVILN